MAVRRSTEDIPAGTEIPLGPTCSLCEGEMPNNLECVATSCKHIFHRECVTKWLLNSQECPNCKKLCHQKDLVSVCSKPSTTTQGSNYRGRVRGSATKKYNTRSSRVQEASLDFPQAVQAEVEENVTLQGNSQEFTCSNNRQNYSHSLHNSNRGRRNNRNLNRMSQIVETTVQRVLMNMNISPVQLQQNVQPLHNRYEQPDASSYNYRDQNILPIPNNGNRITSNSGNLNPDRITSMIQSWNVKFDGSLKGLRCEEFLYRIHVLTVENFNGNFDDTVCKNLHVLLTGKVKDWF